MTALKFLFIFLLSSLLISVFLDCQSSDNQTRTALTNSGTNGAFAEMQNLCDPAERNYALTTLGLPNGSTISRDTLTRYLQYRANKLSWMTFIAMNWRANADGTPDSSQCFGVRDGVTVWEHWMPGPELFRVDNQPPRLWQYGSTGGGHPKNSLDEPKFRYFKLNVLSTFNPERLPVPNQDGNNTLYEVYYNRQMYDYIVGGKLYSIAGQQQFVKQWPWQANGLLFTNAAQNDTMTLEKTGGRVYLPIGSPKDTTFYYAPNGVSGQLHFYKNLGSIMVKSAWTILTPAQESAQYHTRVVRMNGKQVKLGLVALHIAHKLAEAPQWMWSTFEHVKNAPSANSKGVAVLEPGVDYLYFDEKRSDWNDPRTYNKPPTAGNRIQLVNVYNPADTTVAATAKINGQFHALMYQANKQSVWLNYRLVGTQWPSIDPDPLIIKDTATVPRKLANSMMETYHQATSSCLSCHSNARILNDSAHHGYFADFAWGLSLGRNTKKKMHKYAN